MVFADKGEIISGGNFHGEYPAKVITAIKDIFYYMIISLEINWLYCLNQKIYMYASFHMHIIITYLKLFKLISNLIK